jgi:hypothetical protein
MLGASQPVSRYRRVLTAVFLLLALTGCAAFLLVNMVQGLALAFRIQMREITVDTVLALACVSGVILLLGATRDRHDRALIADWLDEHACLHTCCVEGHYPPVASPPPPPPIPSPLEKTGVVKAFYVAQRDVTNVKYYEERFKGGSDLQPRQHERVLPLHAIH